MYSKEYLSKASNLLSNVKIDLTEAINSLFHATDKNTEGVENLTEEQYNDILHIMNSLSNIRIEIIKLEIKL